MKEIDGISRRRLLQVGASSYLGLTLPTLLRSDWRRAHAGEIQAASADHCIVIFLNGGPSHLDMWDMKPEAPAEIRGEFKPIATDLPGVQLSEMLPKMATLMRHCSLIRSAHHSVNNAHAAAVYAALTGHDRGELGGGAKPTDYPAIGSVVASLRPTNSLAPGFVNLPYITKEGAGGPPQPGFFGGWLGRAHDPLQILRDPNAPDFSVPEMNLAEDLSPQRFDERKTLLQATSKLARDTGPVEVEAFRAKAMQLLGSSASRRAFHLDAEPPTTRDRYGRNIYGQSVLLGRRLIEAGVRVVTVSWAPDANATWDTHGNNFRTLRSTLLPQLDLAVSALLTDLLQRGMLERTLVAVMGEFGRTPKVNANAGRDHWNFCYSLLLAGGGIRPGHVFGSSDRIGAFPATQPIGPADVVATLYHCMGVSHEQELRDRLDRPMAIVPWGQPIQELLV